MNVLATLASYKPKRRVINRLRKAFPGRWTWNQGLYRWEHESGDYVQACAQLAQRWDGDDDNYVTVYYYYPAGGRPTERIYF